MWGFGFILRRFRTVSSNDDNSLSLDDEHTRLAAAIGHALAQWAGIEYRLCLIFCRALASHSLTCSSAAFYSVVNFRTKLEMTSAAVHARHEAKHILPDWKSLFSKLSTANQQRVPLAHPTIMQYPQARPGDRCFVESAIMDSRTWPETDGKPFRLSVANVKDREQSFHALMLECEGFSQKIQQISMPQPRSIQMRHHGDGPASLKRRANQIFRKREPPSQE